MDRTFSSKREIVFNYRVLAVDTLADTFVNGSR